MRKFNVLKAIPRALNMVAEGAVSSYRSVVNSPRNFITGGKDTLENKGKHTSASTPVKKLIPMLSPLSKDVDNAKKPAKL